MHRFFLLCLIVSFGIALPACGGGEDSGPVVEDNPFGSTKSGTPVTMDDLKEQMKEHMPNLDGMPNMNDPEAMKKWAADMKDKAMEGFKNDKSSITEAELASWYEAAKAMADAKSSGDKAVQMAAYQKYGAKFAMQGIKVAKVLGYYRVRRDSGNLNETDKQNAAMYEKYIKLMDALGDK